MGSQLLCLFALCIAQTQLETAPPDFPPRPTLAEESRSTIDAATPFDPLNLRRKLVDVADFPSLRVVENSDQATDLGGWIFGSSEPGNSTEADVHLTIAGAGCAFGLGQLFELQGQDAYSDRPPVAELFNPFIRRFPYPMEGPYPYRFGWSKYDDITYMAAANTNGVKGSLQQAEWNAAIQYAVPFWNGSTFAWTGVANARYWTGPGGVALPGQVNQLAADFELTTPMDDAWSVQLGFTPQIASDFRRSVNSGAYSFDGRAIAYYQTSANLTFAIGAAYWNRVRDRIIPELGIIWIPDDRWELRLLFPKTQINYFAGYVWQMPVWLYVSGEYTAEAYQVDIEDTRFKDRMEMSDYRLLAGISTRHGRFSGFLEGGWVMHRRVRFQGSTPNFDIADGSLVRAGFKF